MALVSTYNAKIRPLLDVVDKLRSLDVSSEGIKLPTIVVVGDQSSGKSSVLESLSGISLPRGNGIVTRVPLVLRLQKSKRSVVRIEYGSVSQDVTDIESAVENATIHLAGGSKGIANRPISLTVQGPGLPDLTLVDLPGITRVPTVGQPRDIYNQIRNMILEYIKPEESVILNVIPANVDFSTCESIALSRDVDANGQRTLAVVTKVDRDPETVYERVTNNDVNVGLGYICVRNRVPDDASLEAARINEAYLFTNNKFLSKLEQSMWGIPSLASRLTAIQMDRLHGVLPRIEHEIKSKLAARKLELAAIPPGITTSTEAMVEFNRILTERRERMRSLLNADYNLYPAKEMHYPARLDSIFSEFAASVREKSSNFFSAEYVKKCSRAMAEHRGVSLANFLSSEVFLQLLRAEVDIMAPLCASLVDKACDCAKKVAIKVGKDASSSYPSASNVVLRATVAAVEEVNDICLQKVQHQLQIERSFAFTLNDCYMDTINSVRSKVKEIKAAAAAAPVLPKQGYRASIFQKDYEEHGDAQVEELAKNEDEATLEMQINVYAYWKVVQDRLCDGICMELRFMLEQILLRDVNESAMRYVGDNGEDVLTLMDIVPGLKQKRAALEASLKKLHEASKTLSESLHRI